jgi:nucleotide-binding universal stress UspA family protein
MVALDGSHSSENALDYVIRTMDKNADDLFLVSVTQNLLGNYGVWTAAEFSVLAENTQLQLEKETISLLHTYGKRCHRAGVKHVFGMRGTGHIGEIICKAAETKNVDLLAIGRRGKLKNVATM